MCKAVLVAPHCLWSLCGTDPDGQTGRGNRHSTETYAPQLCTTPKPLSQSFLRIPAASSSPAPNGPHHATAKPTRPPPPNPQVVREGSRRVLGLRPFDVQLIGGMILHEGQIAEMRTGEGKTLVAVLPAYLNALTGRGVHVVTVNDYLARRDSEWVGQVHRFLGLSVGLIQVRRWQERGEGGGVSSCQLQNKSGAKGGLEAVGERREGTCYQYLGELMSRTHKGGAG